MTSKRQENVNGLYPASRVLSAVLLGGIISGCQASSNDGSADDEGDPGWSDKFLPDAPLELLCPEDGVVLSGSCGNGEEDPGETCFSRGATAPMLGLRGIVAADLDANGGEELIAFTEKSITIYWELAQNGFAVATEWVNPSNSYVARVGVADVDGDGFPEIVATRLGPPVEIFALDASPGEDVEQTDLIQVPDVDGRADVLEVADFSSDGYADAVVSAWDEDARESVLITVFGSADGMDPTYDSKELSVRPKLDRVAVGDVASGDGPELIVLDEEQRRLLAYSWSGAEPTTATLDTESYPQVIAVFDANGDGNVDVALGGRGTIEYWAGNGAGAFEKLGAEGVGLFTDRYMMRSGTFARGEQSILHLQTKETGEISTVLSVAAIVDGVPSIATCYGYEEHRTFSLTSFDTNGDGIDDPILATVNGIVVYESTR